MRHLKKLLQKIEIHPLTMIYIVLAMIVDCYEQYINLYLLVCFHEICHFLMAYFFHFKIDKIKLLPFGAYLSLKDYGFHLRKEEICVVLAGPMSHIIIWLLSYFIFIDETILLYNKVLFCFNFIPIYPLDGYRLILLFIQGFIDLKKSHYIMVKISFLCLCYYYTTCCYIAHYILFIYFLYQNIINYLNIYSYIQRYYLKIPFLKKIDRIVIHKKIKYRRDCYNYYYFNHLLFDEEEMKYHLIKNIKSVEK